ncbi:hypothetical protein Y032_0938g3125 [Ancylostoma ceylanicum]|uniref:Uncharacterized protein n=1 Tax=Ancylostoma ceylanicum TaxID=53326 RepID=A0A016W8Y7_9BILA|nr:hypothetical protein Y032_0938g3125 [Ancylostoma ceylanicum]
MCHRLATYDAKTKTCRCTKPENDILETKWFPITASEQSYTRVTYIFNFNSSNGFIMVNLLIRHFVTATKFLIRERRGKQTHWEFRLTSPPCNREQLHHSSMYPASRSAASPRFANDSDFCESTPLRIYFTNLFL